MIFLPLFINQTYSKLLLYYVKSICVLFFTGLVYVVDSNDRERILESREELFAILENNEMRGVPVVIIANKQDQPSEYYRVI